jgi:hypothetical protein
VVAVLNALQIHAVMEQTYEAAKISGMSNLTTQLMLRTIGSVITPAIFLVGLGAVIEILDQIRWDTRPRQ